MRLVHIGVLTPVQQSERGIHLFIIPKKGGMEDFITDYQKVHKMIRCKPYPIPHMPICSNSWRGSSMPQPLLSMGYYTICLTPGVKDLTT